MCRSEECAGVRRVREECRSEECRSEECVGGRSV